MLLTCPSCSTKYQVPDGSIPPDGRKVRCTSCAHVWHQGPEEETFDLVLEEAPPEEQVEVEPQPEPKPEPEPVLSGDEPRKFKRPETPETLIQRKPKKKRGILRGFTWLLLLLLLGAVGAGAIVFRQKIIDYLPENAKYQAADIYDMMGLPFKLPGYGLKIDVTKSSRQSRDDVPVLVIEGKVTNVSRRTRNLPRIRASLRDKTDKELQSWLFKLKEATLEPDGTATFTTSIDNPKPNARKLGLNFEGAQ